MGPFSLTGQPNAMGGREVGGLANQLAAHMNFSPAEIDRVRRFWDAPRIATHEGLKAVQMFEAIERGEIKALWVMATNPAVSLPRAGAVRDALRKLELFVVSENVLSNDTRERRRAHSAARRRVGREGRHGDEFRAAHLAPARVSCRCPARRSPTGGSSAKSRGAWALRDAFAYATAADIFREHAALSAFENDGTRDFDLGALARHQRRGLRRARSGASGRCAKAQTGRATRFFADGGFFTPDRKARFVAPEAPALRDGDVATTIPFVLNTGRVRDQWHTMTRTGLSPRLGQHTPEPFVEIHPGGCARASA